MLLPGVPDVMARCGAVAAGVAVESPRLNLAGVAGVVFAAVGVSFALALWLATG